MKILYFSLKGGVGKSSIALNHAIHNSYAYVTNDITTSTDGECVSEFHHIPHNTKRIPKKLLPLQDVIFDFGAMSSVIDAKVTQAVTHCDCVVIPTLTDARSIQATMNTYDLIKEKAKRVVIIINNFQKEEKCLYAKVQLDHLKRKVLILEMKHTTLFERVARDGVLWYTKIGSQKGEYRLQKTKLEHQKIYEAIQNYGAQR